MAALMRDTIWKEPEGWSELCLLQAVKGQSISLGIDKAIERNKRQRGKQLDIVDTMNTLPCKEWLNGNLNEACIGT